LFFTKKKKKAGQGWVSPKFVFTSILIFLCLETPCKISEPYDNPFWVKSNLGGKRESKRNNAVNSGHFSSVTAHAHYFHLHTLEGHLPFSG
jgi:hypothetical protein